MQEEAFKKITGCASRKLATTLHRSEKTQEKYERAIEHKEEVLRKFFKRATDYEFTWYVHSNLKFEDNWRTEKEYTYESIRYVSSGNISARRD